LNPKTQLLSVIGHKYKQKKAACFFPAGRLILESINFLYSKSPLARRILSRRPPPTGIFAVDLLHDYTIIPQKSFSVKPHPQKNSKTEQEGFEPPVPFGTTVFKTVAFSRSATAPTLYLQYFTSAALNPKPETVLKPVLIKTTT
jgi:hypothetical protein